MNIAGAIILGIIGAVLGFLIPKIIKYFILSKKKAEYVVPGYINSLEIKLVFCLINAAVWVLSGLLMGNIITALLVAILISVAIIITAIDLLIRIIPNYLVLAMLIAGVVFQISTSGLRGLLYALVCGVLMMAVFTAVAGIVGFGGVGAGDVKLAGAMGLALGYPQILTALIIMAAVLLVYCLGGLLMKKLTLKSSFPFAPFMMAGMIFALVSQILAINPIGYI